MTGSSSARAHSISSQLWIADRQMRRFLTSLYRLTTPSATTSSTRPPRPSAFIMMTSPRHPVISAYLPSSRRISRHLGVYPVISAYLPSSRRISDSSRRISESSRRISDSSRRISDSSRCISRHLGISPIRCDSHKRTPHARRSSSPLRRPRRFLRRIRR